MHVIRHAADTVGFTICIARYGGEISVKPGADGFRETRASILRAEDDMDGDKAEGLRHDVKGIETGFQPLLICWAFNLGRWPGLVWCGPLGLPVQRR